MRTLAKQFFSLSILAAFTTSTTAQDCQQICSQMNAFARQSRGDWAFVQQMQQLSNACQSCQLQQRVRPQVSTPPPTMPQWTPPVQTEQEKAQGRAMNEVFERQGEWIMRGKVLPGNIPLSSGTVQMEIVKIPDSYVDPFAQRAPSVSHATSSRPTVSGNIYDPNQQSHMQPTQSPNQPSTNLGPATTYPSYPPCTGFNAPGSNVSPCGK